MKKNLLLLIAILSVICGLYGQNQSLLETNMQFNAPMPDRYLHYQGTFYTHYYGIRYGNNSAMILNPSDTLFYLQDNDAAVAIYKLGPGETSFPLVSNTYYNPSKIWGNPPLAKSFQLPQRIFST